MTQIREEQDIIVVACRRSCSGTCSVSWGGRISEFLALDYTAEEFEAAINHLVAPFSISNDGSFAVKVARKANGFA